MRAELYFSLNWQGLCLFTFILLHVFSLVVTVFHLLFLTFLPFHSSKFKSALALYLRMDWGVERMIASCQKPLQLIILPSDKSQHPIPGDHSSQHVLCAVLFQADYFLLLFKRISCSISRFTSRFTRFTKGLLHQLAVKKFDCKPAHLGKQAGSGGFKK